MHDEPRPSAGRHPSARLLEKVSLGAAPRFFGSRLLTVIAVRQYPFPIIITGSSSHDRELYTLGLIQKQWRLRFRHGLTVCTTWEECARSFHRRF